MQKAAATQTVAEKAEKKIRRQEKRKQNLRLLKNQKILHAMILPGIIWMAIFCYWPMLGLIGAFQNYDPMKGFLRSEWVGLAHFKEMFQDELFVRSLVNMLGMSAVKIVFAIVMPIVFALRTIQI